MSNLTEKMKINENLIIAQQLYKESKLDEAIQFYNEVIKLDSNNLEAWQKNGEIYEKKEDEEKAINCYKKIIQLQPQNINKRLQLGRILTKQKKYDDALNVATQALEVSIDDPSIYRFIGWSFTLKKDFQEAIVNYQKAIKLDKNQPEWVYKNLGNALFVTNQLLQAILVYKCGIDLMPNSAMLYLALAEAQLQAQRFNEAIESYRKARELEPKSSILSCLEKIDLSMDNLDKTVLIFDKIFTLKLDGSQIEEIIRTLGKKIFQLTRKENKLNKTVAIFQKICNSVESYWANYYLAASLATIGELDAAIKHYTDSISINKSLHLSYLGLGEIYLKQKNKEKVLQCCIEGVSIQPDNREIHTLFQRAIDAFGDQITDDELKKLEKALLSALNHSGELSDKSIVGLCIAIATILRKQNRTIESVPYNQKAIYHQIYTSKSDFVNKYYNKGKGVIREPNFLIVGFMKCGSTALFKYLIQHPKIIQPTNKEPNFLGRLVSKESEKLIGSGCNISLSKDDKSFYYSLFPPRTREEGGFISGEASIASTLTAGVENLIYNSFPKIKLIIVLRDPVDRAISHYYYWLRNGIETRTIDEAINSELDTIEKYSNLYEYTKNKVNLNSYVGIGLYYYMVERYTKIFRKEQLLIVESQEMEKNRKKVLGTVFDFLNIDNLESYESMNLAKQNKGSYSSSHKVSTVNVRKRLSNFYKSHNRKLEELLNKKFNWS